MGCNNMTSKKPLQRKAEESKENKNNHTQGTPNPQIKVVVNYKGKVLLEKTFKQDTLVEKVVQEIQASMPNFTKEAVYEYLCRNNSVLEKMKSPLKSLLTASDQTSGTTPGDLVIEVNLTGLEDLPLNTDTAYQNVNFLARPLVDPFEIAIFEKDTGKFRIESLNEDLQNHAEIRVYSELSAYCNGNNHLYISGGEYNNSVILGHFWDIDISKKTILKNKPGLSTPRKLHSMVYVPNKYVFIVGGIGVKSVEFYDTEKKEISLHSELVEERSEPALCLVNNTYLYAFTGFTHQKSNFERINLRSGKKTWELVIPKVDPLAGRFNQNFFAACHHVDGEIIFIGGVMIGKNDSNGNSDSTSKDYSFIYDWKENLIKKSLLPHRDHDYSEKFFLPLETNNNYLIPNFERENINLLKYTVNEQMCVINFESDPDVSVYDDAHPFNEFTLFQDETKKNKYVAKESTSRVVVEQPQNKGNNNVESTNQGNADAPGLNDNNNVHNEAGKEKINEETKKEVVDNKVDSKQKDNYNQQVEIEKEKTVEPEEKTVEPEGKKVEPEEKTVEPEGKKVEPEEPEEKQVVFEEKQTDRTPVVEKDKETDQEENNKPSVSENRDNQKKDEVVIDNEDNKSQKSRKSHKSHKSHSSHKSHKSHSSHKSAANNGNGNANTIGNAVAEGMEIKTEAENKINMFLNNLNAEVDAAANIENQINTGLNAIEDIREEVNLNADVGADVNANIVDGNAIKVSAEIDLGW